MPVTIITAKYLPLLHHESERNNNEESGNQKVAIIWNCKKGQEIGKRSYRLNGKSRTMRRKEYYGGVKYDNYSVNMFIQEGAYL